MLDVKTFDRVTYAAKMRLNGWWSDRTTDSLLVDAVAQHPNKDAIVAYRSDRRDELPRRFTFSEFGDGAARAAGALHALGIGAGDIIAVQVPNWWEFAVMVFACGRIGAVVNPLMPILRERELSFMLAMSEAKVFVVPKVFRGFDYEAMAQALQPKLSKLAHVIVVDGDGDNSFDRMLLAGSAMVPAASHPGKEPAKAEDLAVLMFTSGTAGEPKGVMHSSNSLIACVSGLRDRFGLTEKDVILACSPLGHMTGYAASLLQGLCLGMTVVLLDVWDAKHAVAIMNAEGITHTAAATPFLADICEAVAAGAPDPRLRTFLCAGATIPPALIERALRELALPVSSLWGMTESLASTLTEPSRATEKSSSTDGRPLEGVEVRVVENDGAPLATGKTGRLLVRGAQMFIGYYKRPELPTFDADGWFDTGDLAYMDSEGYIRINGRAKDVLIRGGENVPVVEIENLLYQHPAVATVALVGFPDERLGERGCAFITLRPGQRFDLTELQRYMDECKVAKPYWPERVEIVDELPRTASGKIQKFALRERAKAFGDAL
jgi:cyclohexanecarboxylate-CoA ligase